MGRRGEPANETPHPNSIWRESPVATLERRKAEVEVNKQIAKEIMIAYISHSPGPAALFNPGSEKHFAFEAVWNTILRTVSTQAK